MQTILFFDLDSTLVVNHFSGRVLRTVLAEVAEASGKSLKDLSRELGAENTRRQELDPDHILTMDWADIAVSIARNYGVTLSNSVDDLWRTYANAQEVEILDNAAQVLAQIKTGRTIVLTTKGLSKYQDPVLEVTGLDAYFDAILTPDKVGYLKTSPAYFQGYQGQNALFIQIGDHYYDDIICAKRNGFYAILRAPIAELAPYSPFERPQFLAQYQAAISTYPTTGTDILPDALILSLEELPTVIRHIEAQHA